MSVYSDDHLGLPSDMLIVDSAVDNREARTRKGSTPTANTFREQVSIEVSQASRSSPEGRKSDRQWHTIQLEYNEDQPEEPSHARFDAVKEQAPGADDGYIYVQNGTDVDSESDFLQISDAISPEESDHTHSNHRSASC